MHGHVGPRRIADVLHDVELTGVGPSSGAKRPERGPESGAGGELDACGRSAVGELGLAAAVDAAGREIERPALRRLEPGTIARANPERASVGASRVRAGDDVDRLGRIDVRLL